MSQFEKIIIPLGIAGLKKEYFSKESGFTDSYTIDPDHPTDLHNIYLLYDAETRSTESIERARAFSSSKYLKYQYIKYISGSPYIVYCFYTGDYGKYYFNGVFQLYYNQIVTILQFWGLNDDITKVLIDTKAISVDTKHDMPLDDYRPERLELCA